jgi:hypothetical protein
MFNSAVGLGIGGETDEYDPYDTRAFREAVFAPVTIKQEPVEAPKRKREDGKPGKVASKKARKTETSDQQSESTEPKFRRSKKDKKREKKDKHRKRDKSGGHAPGGVDGTSEGLQTSEGANAAPGIDPPMRTPTPVIPPPVLDTVPIRPLRATTPVIPPTVPTLLPAPSRSSLGPDIAQHRDVPNESFGTVDPANLQKQDQDAMSPGRLHIGDRVPENENHLAEDNVDEKSSGIGNSTHGTRTDCLGSDEADDETGDDETDDDEDNDDSPTDSSQRSSSE